MYKSTKMKPTNLYNQCMLIKMWEKKKEINSGAKEFSEQNLKYDREP